MHFDLYLDNKFLLYLYGNYFWYDELNRATQVIAAYVGEKLAGVLLADIKGEKKSYRSFGKTMYIQIFNLLQKLFYKGGAGVYDTTNQVLFREYRKCHCPDGRLYLAANPAFQQKESAANYWKNWSVVKKENRSTYIPMISLYLPIL